MQSNLNLNSLFKEINGIRLQFFIQLETKQI
jgi:hypothetical protein